jgi:hypothetical protein
MQAVLQWLLNYAVSLEYADAGESDCTATGSSCASLASLISLASVQGWSCLEQGTALSARLCHHTALQSPGSWHGCCHNATQCMRVMQCMQTHASYIDCMTHDAAMFPVVLHGMMPLALHRTC